MTTQVLPLAADVVIDTADFGRVQGNHVKRDSAHQLADPTVELIPPYAHEAAGIVHDEYETKKPAAWAKACRETGGYNPYTNELRPLKFGSAEMHVHEALDHITAAVEAGLVDRNNWSEQLFADDDELEAFFEQLEEYDDCFRITDRWWRALAHLADTNDEEGFIRSSEIVAGLRDGMEAGVARRDMLMHEAEYFARHPLVEVDLDDTQSSALSARNVQTKRKALAQGAEEDLSLQFRFTAPLLELTGGRLTARQATAQDVLALVSKVAKKRAPRS